MSVHIHLEHIVLDGLPIPPGGRPVFAAAFTEELQRRIAAADPAALTTQQSGLRTPVLRVTANATPAQLGRQLAATIAGSLTDGTRPSGHTRRAT